MGFAEIFPEYTGRKRRRAERAYADFGVEHPQVHQNLDNDRQIRDSDRKDLLDNWLGARATGPSKRSGQYLALCCGSKQQIGRQRSAARRHVLGHCFPKSKLERRLQERNRTKGPLLGGVRDARDTIDHILKSPPARQRKLMQLVGVSYKQMWSNYDTNNSTDPFAGVRLDKAELQRRLGLGHLDLSRDNLLVIRHELLEDTVPRFPTTFDSETSDFFRPGGKTLPLTGPARDGFPEVVHDAIPGETITQLTQVV